MREFLSAGKMMRFWVMAACLTVLAALAGCSGGPAAEEIPPPLVRDMTVSRQDVPRTLEYMGQTAGSREVEVRARVGGILLRRTYQEGTAVQEGTTLFRIDPEPFLAELNQARGDLAKSQAEMVRTKLENDRTGALFGEKAVSAQERDNALAAYRSAAAAVEADRARVRDAQLKLGYTEVKAPISGVTSREVRSEGSLVTTDTDGSLLTTIYQMDPLYVNFSIPGSEMDQMRRLKAEGRWVEPADGFAVRLQLQTGDLYGRTGRITFAGSQVDPQTGTVRIRAELPNPDGAVLPGQFVRVLLEGGVLKDYIVVPQRAVLFTQNGAMVYSLDDKNIASPVPVKLGQTVGDSFVVESGLEPGIRIVAEGVIKVRPGQPVNINPPGPAGEPDSGGGKDQSPSPEHGAKSS